MSEPYGALPGRYPAVIQSYDASRRTCRVAIPGLTGDSGPYPEAEIEYPIGDKSRSRANGTEIEITPGDSVWVAFHAGDSRYPIITGYRNPQAGNDVDWRRWHHANMELLAEHVMNLIAGGAITAQSAVQVNIKAPTVVIDSKTTINNGNLVVKGMTSLEGGMNGSGGGDSTIAVKGNVSVDGNINASGGIYGSSSDNNHSH